MTNLDYTIFQQLNNFAGRWAALDWLGVFAADYLQYLVGVGFVLLLFLSREERIKKYRLAGAVLGAIVLSRFIFTEIIYWIWFQPRPFIDHAVNLLVSHGNSGSWPSGHAAFFFALAMIVYFFNRRAGQWLFAAAILISIARIFVGVHYPSDILAGAVVGIFSGWLVRKIFQYYQNKKAR